MDQGQEHSGSFFGLAFGAESPVLPCKEAHLPTDPPLEQEQEELKERSVNASCQADAANKRVVDRAGAQPALPVQEPREQPHLAPLAVSRASTSSHTSFQLGKRRFTQSLWMCTAWA